MPDVTYRDMLARYDLRMLLRICFDDPPNSHAVHTDWELGESPILNAALGDAKGAVKSALEVAGNYNEWDMEHLSPESVSLYKRIVCELAISYLYSRRGAEGVKTITELRQAAEDYLDRIRKGERIFVIAHSSEKQEAGQPKLVAPTAVQLVGLNNITQRADVYFGPVAKRLHNVPYRGN